jgi:hypothetical protein
MQTLNTGFTIATESEDLASFLTSLRSFRDLCEAVSRVNLAARLAKS